MTAHTTQDSTRASAAADLLAAVSRLMRTSRSISHQRSQALGASGTAFAALKALALGDARAGDLAGRLSVSASVVSRTISSLEQDGLVERRQDPDDARASRIGLSELGRLRIERQHQEYVSILSSSLADWEPDEVAAATRALVRLDEVFSEQAHALRHAAAPLSLLADKTSVA